MYHIFFTQNPKVFQPTILALVLLKLERTKLHTNCTTNALLKLYTKPTPIQRIKVNKF